MFCIVGLFGGAAYYLFPGLTTWAFVCIDLTGQKILN